MESLASRYRVVILPESVRYLMVASFRLVGATRSTCTHSVDFHLLDDDAQLYGMTRECVTAGRSGSDRSDGRPEWE